MGTGREKAPRYRAFLLRCWEVQGGQKGQPGTWRFQLQDVDTGERRSFVDLEGLMGFLRQELELQRKDFGRVAGPEG